MKADENSFRERLALESKRSPQTLKLYVHCNFDFLNALIVEGYSLTSIAAVISKDLDKKIYPSNLGRLMKKYSQSHQSNPVIDDVGSFKAAIEEKLTSLRSQPKIISSETAPTENKNKKTQSDPLGIGGLM